MKKITIYDSILAKADKALISHIKPCVHYDYSYWVQGRYGKIEKKQKGYFINRKGEFLSGLVPRICDRLKKTNIDFKIVHKVRAEQRILPEPKEQKLKGVKLRHYQKLDNITSGVILSATGTGKTVIFLSLISMFPTCNILFLSHRNDLKTQCLEMMEEYKIKSIYIVENGKCKSFNKKKRIVSTVQTFSNLSSDLYYNYFDIIVVDEAHHVNSAKSQYGKILQQSIAPLKMGVTATLPNRIDQQLALEGLIGPVIMEYTEKQAEQDGYLAKVKVKLIPIPEQKDISDLKTYQNIYENGIINNRIRNRIIVENAKRFVDEKKSILIIVNRIEHGEILLKMANLIGLNAKFVRGKTDRQERIKIKKTFIKKEILCVICTDVWREGINIPSLNVVVNASAGKAKTMVVQAVGRGTRITKGKEDLILIDFIDPYKHLAWHTVSRIAIYAEKGWL